MNHDHAQPNHEHAEPENENAQPEHEHVQSDHEHIPAPIAVGRPAGTGGRRVTIRGRSAGVAHSDADVVEFLRRAGLPDAWEYLDDPHWVDWQDGRPRTYDTTPPGHGDHGEVIG
ncbi:hypothetical protein ACFVU0_31240 [Streptomyces sp. NPDC058122]|uniref:hypothetical protein n=1 Tax=Streptomyces sp. NPDC058122 TaxID=3346349 RepID=UPI0036EE247F